VHFTLKQYMQFAGITDEAEAMERIQEFVKVFGIKKINDDTFDIPTSHLASLKIGRSEMMNTGMEWKCECGVVNNAKNGEKCLKCNFTYKDWVFRKQEEYLKNQSIRYQPITDREVACFLFGKFNHMIQSQIPKTNNLEKRVQMANIAGSITFDFIKAMESQYNTLREGEIFDLMNQLGNPNTSIIFQKIMNNLQDELKSIFNP